MRKALNTCSGPWHLSELRRSCKLGLLSEKWANGLYGLFRSYSVPDWYPFEKRVYRLRLKLRDWLGVNSVAIVVKLSCYDGRVRRSYRSMERRDDFLRMVWLMAVTYWFIEVLLLMSGMVLTAYCDARSIGSTEHGGRLIAERRLKRVPVVSPMVWVVGSYCSLLLFFLLAFFTFLWYCFLDFQTEAVYFHKFSLYQIKSVFFVFKNDIEKASFFLFEN